MTDPLQLPVPGALLDGLPRHVRGYLGGYLIELYGRSGSERTAMEYARILRRFLATVGPELTEVTPGQVQRFAFAPTHGPGGIPGIPSPSTIRVRLAAIRGFLDYLRRLLVLKYNPASLVRGPLGRRSAARGLSGEQVRQLLAVIPDTPSGLRDRAAILVMVLAGLRRTEALGLRAGDLTRNGTVYYTARTKGGQERRRELPGPALRAMERAVEASGRRLEDLGPSERLLPISGRGFAANLERYARRAGLEGVTPHVLRHSAAKLRREAGATIEDVQALLGHRSLATTATYLRRLEGEEDAGWAPVAAALGLEE